MMRSAMVPEATAAEKKMNIKIGSIAKIMLGISCVEAHAIPR